MTISILQERATDTSLSGTTISLAFSANVTAGSSIHVGGSWGTVASGSGTCSDSVNGSYGAALSAFNNSSLFQSLSHFNKDGAAGGATTVSFVPPATSSFRGICIREIGGTSGLDTGSGNTNGQTTPGTGAGAIVGVSTTPSTQPGLISGICADISTAHSLAAASGFTAGFSAASNQWPNVGSLATESLRYTITTAQQGAFTDSTGGSADSYITATALYKESSSGVSKSLVGQAITSTEGTPTPAVSYGLTGRSIASTLGTITPQVIYGLTGQAITSTQGTPTPTVSYGLTGQAITSTEGTPSPTVSYGLTGQSITSTEGTITASTGGGASRTLVGQTITSTLGVITAQWSASQNLIGQRINSTLGTITATVTTDTFLMPNLVLLNYYEALEMLQNLGIYIPLPAYAFAPSSIAVQWQKSGYPAGLVIAQSPAVGAGVNPGQNVLLTLSAFPFGSVIDNPPDWKQ